MAKPPLQYYTIMQNTLWAAPAKLNLFLHIVAQIQSGQWQGYHELQSIFHLLDYGDSLSFKLTNNPNIEIISKELFLPLQQNLIYRAVQVLKNYAQQKNLPTTGVRIQLHKRLPIGGGVGGGSSNAATTLIILNELWNLQLNQNMLCKLALSLGADVPIFVVGSTAFVEGIGDKITPIKVSNQWYVVITPSVHVNSANIFAHPALTRDTTKVKIGAWYGQAEFGHNDCQNVVCQYYPEVSEVLNWLNQFSLSRGRLTGTGSSVFAKCSSRKQAEKIVSKISYPTKGFCAQGVEKSPLHLQLNQLKNIFGV